jgi:sn-glycerol 3-phosphate transport system ATP-binding protein
MLKMDVDLPEQLGASTLIHGCISGLDTPFTASLNGIQTAVSGDLLEFDVPTHQIHIFSAETGNRIS